MKRSWNDEQLTNAVKSGTSIAEVLKQLNFLPIGSNYNWIKKHIKRLNLSTTHFVPYKGSFGKIKSTEELFLSKSTNTHVLRKRIIKENLLKYECNSCKVIDQIFYGAKKELSLHLDHIDGNPTNNKLENLRFLCPNCHSLTDTYCGKNTKRELKYISCLGCQSSIEKGTRCGSCKDQYNKVFKSSKNWPDIDHFFEKAKEFKSMSKTCFFFNSSSNGMKKYLARKDRLEEAKQLFKKLQNEKHLKITTNKRKVAWPSKEQLEKLVWEKSTVKIAQELGVSDKAVEKWCKKYCISKPPRGYWAKFYSKDS